MDLEKFYQQMNIIDATGHEISIGTPVVVLTAGNFIYGHVQAISEDKVEVLPDIGYRTSKPNFRLKKLYKAKPDNIAMIVTTSKDESEHDMSETFAE